MRQQSDLTRERVFQLSSQNHSHIFVHIDNALSKGISERSNVKILGLA